MSNNHFEHRQHAHCESGVTSNLLHHQHIELSEPMAFGIGAGLFFGHLPFLKVSGTPGTTFRTWPGAIFKRVAKRLGITVHTETFRSPQKAMEALDKELEAGRPVGILCSVFYLPYLPEAFRFHFNAHNIIVYGKEDGEYLVSDPVMEQNTRIAPEDLSKARFAKGVPEPNGMMYYVTNTSSNINLEKAIKEGIKQTCFMMQSPPFPWFGTKAIFLLSNQIKNYPKKLTPRQASLYLGNIIRMQEEIGTGGAGFRYLYAAFLQEAAKILKREDIREFSTELTQIGDEWRNFAYSAARLMKDRKSDLVSYEELSNKLRSCGEKEKSFYKRLSALKW